MNGVLAKPCGSIGNKSSSKVGHGKANKYNSIIYYCYICKFVEHKIYDYFHKDATQAMFRKNITMATPKKDDVAIKMVLVITTHN